MSGKEQRVEFLHLLDLTLRYRTSRMPCCGGLRIDERCNVNSSASRSFYGSMTKM